MAQHIDGPLYYEQMGKRGPVIAFVHPNPMDQSCWIFQMAQMSTWFRCIAIDVPGYGRSPKSQPGLTMQDLAQGCWEADRRCAARRAGDSRRLFGRLGDHRAHASSAARQDQGADLFRHRLHAGQGVHSAAGEVLHRGRPRLPLDVHVRGLQPGVPREPNGAFLCRHVHGAQRHGRLAVHSLPVRGARAAGRRSIIIRACNARASS